MSAGVTVRHNFETAHRLPDMGAAKCVNLHGHSWWVEVTVTAPTTDGRGAVVEFGAFKKGLRDWIDSNLDHGAMLHHTDPLADVLSAHGCKVLRTEEPPTVENTAALLASVAESILEFTDHAEGAHVSHVRVSETHVNAAAWSAT